MHVAWGADCSGPQIWPHSHIPDALCILLTLASMAVGGLPSCNCLPRTTAAENKGLMTTEKHHPPLEPKESEEAADPGNRDACPHCSGGAEVQLGCLCLESSWGRAPAVETLRRIYQITCYTRWKGQEVIGATCPLCAPSPLLPSFPLPKFKRLAWYSPVLHASIT